ncbi:tyrosine-type recombinase/integrase [Nonomuraea sp. NPDC055795]
MSYGSTGYKVDVHTNLIPGIGAHRLDKLTPEHLEKLQWADVDLDRGTLRVQRGRQRPRYEHGCGGICGRKPGYCKKRVQVREVTAATKSRAGRRTIGLPAQLVVLLRKHREEQETERTQARQLWQDGDWVFTTATGGAVSPYSDYHEWKTLLVTAGLRDGRLHDARHTAATVLLILGVPERTVMAIMGWSSSGMARRYQHVTDAIRDTVAKQVDGLLWERKQA